MNDQLIIGLCIGIAFGVFIGINAMSFYYQRSRLKKMQDEYDEDRKRIRRELENAREKMIQ